MIKRKNGLWFICYEKSGTYIEGSGYFKSLDEAQAAEQEILKKFPEPVQTLNKVSEPAKVAESLKTVKSHHKGKY